MNNLFSNFKLPEPNFDFINIKDPDEVTNKILCFLQSQSSIAEKQFKISKNLIIVTIFIMILQIGYAIWINYESNYKQNNLSKIIEMQSKQSEVISHMSLSLLDLQNQVQILEKENKVLSEKKNN